MVRRATVSGQFYAGTKEELEKQIANCFKGKFGAGLPEHKKNNIILGCIVPHAGYEYSGQCASHVYKEIAESKQPDVFVIIGVNHQPSEKGIIISLEDFETPFGIVKNDSGFAKQIIQESVNHKKTKKFAVDVIHDDAQHKFEHSIEVQLPFLQYIFSNSKKQIKIAPIIMSEYTYDSCKSLANIISDVSKKQKKSMCIIASSDFTHYGVNYGFVPFKENIRENLYKLDNESIKKIENMDGEGFLKLAKYSTICGAGAITTAIETCKILGAKKAKKLKYYASADISGSYELAVGYASIIFF